VTIINLPGWLHCEANPMLLLKVETTSLTGDQQTGDQVLRAYSESSRGQRPVHGEAGNPWTSFFRTSSIQKGFGALQM